MSTLHKSLVSISTFALTLGLSSLSYAQNSSIGVNAAVKGDVTIITLEQTTKEAIVKDQVFLGEAINSEKLSSLQVLLKDKTTFTVGPECELTIDKFVYNPNEINNSMVASVSKGMFRFVSGNISKSGASAVSVNTPTASMGIRGTMVEGLIGADAISIAVAAGVLPQGTPVDANGATLFVLRGPGQKTTGTNRKGEITVTSGGNTVIVKDSGKAVFVPSAGAMPIVFSLPPVAFQNFNQKLRTEPTSSDTYGYFEIPSHFTPEYQPSQPANRAGQPQTGTGAGTGINATTAIFGLGTIGAVGTAILISKDDDEPSSP